MNTEGTPISQEDIPRKFERIKRHVKENKERYLIGVSCLAAGYFLRRPPAQIINQVTPNIAPVMNNVMNTIVLPALGDPGNVVQDVLTKEVWASQGALARARDYNPAVVSKYFTGKIPDLYGFQYEILGKAGHPLSNIA